MKPKLLFDSLMQNTSANTPQRRTTHDQLRPFPHRPPIHLLCPSCGGGGEILHIDLAACILNCRRAMECGVKWMYSVDNALVKPWQDTLVNLMNAREFREIVGKESGENEEGK